MRIVVVGPTYPFRGGIAHHTTLLVHHLREAGHDVLFLSFTRQYPRWLYGRDDKDPSQHPLKTKTEYLIDSINPLTWLSAIKRINRFQPDQVIFPWWVPFWAPVWRALSFGITVGVRQRPQILFICHNVLPHESSWFDRLALRIGIGMGDRFIVHAETERVLLQEIFSDVDILVTPHPTYAALGEAQTELPIELPEDRPILLFCGLIRHYKGLDILLDALPLVLDRRDVHLAVVGEFWKDEQAYLDQIGRLKIGSAVSIVNRYVENEVLSAFLHRADVVVLPYRSATQSGVVQLALGHGVPVITTAVGGLIDIAMDDNDQLSSTLVPPENPMALAKAILDHFENEQSESAVPKGDRDQYSWEYFIEKLDRNVG